jgi:DNA repair protein RadD
MLRPYQETALSEIYTHLHAGRSPLLHLPTGAGKTVVFCEILKRLHAKGKRGLMVVRGRQLVQQAHERLNREAVPHGVEMAGHYGQRRREPIQVASVDTLISRNETPEADLTIVDEYHLAGSAGYKRLLQRYNCPVLGVTATPYNHVGICDTIVAPATFNQLVNDGYLSPARYYCPSLPDLKGVKSTKEDYVQTELADRMNRSNLIGDLVHHYTTLAPGRKAVVFAVSIRHSHNIVNSFNNAGIRALHTDANTSLEDRRKAIEDLRNGNLDVISNVGVMGLGIDIPWLDAVILARPTKSLNLHIQQLGRGTRIYPGKEDFIVLDHSGNTLRHRYLEDERQPVLTGKEPKPIIKSPTTCLQCFAVFDGRICPNCKNENPIKMRVLQVKDGELKEVKALSPQEELDRYVAQLKRTIKDKGYKRGYLWHELRRTHGEEIANTYFKRRPEWITRRHIQSLKEKSSSVTEPIQG